MTSYREKIEWLGAQLDRLGLNASIRFDGERIVGGFTACEEDVMLAMTTSDPGRRAQRELATILGMWHEPSTGGSEPAAWDALLEQVAGIQKESQLAQENAALREDLAVALALRTRPNHHPKRTPEWSKMLNMVCAMRENLELLAGEALERDARVRAGNICVDCSGYGQHRSKAGATNGCVRCLGSGEEPDETELPKALRRTRAARLLPRIKRRGFAATRRGHHERAAELEDLFKSVRAVAYGGEP